ncbi:MAG: glycine/sarcosine/betaine reductase selenoprotein B family protein [Alphaproteobacteria bacterium]|jgi:hypothetical protein|nr:glycine/sarcosine/betaine reductase selenoprotein B family protein [Alphaproteobacteria bacterium]
MDYVRYIDRTREYYAAEGYEKPYEWAHFDEVPFTPLAKPLSECRVTIVSTSDVHMKDDQAAQGEFNSMLGNVYSIPSDTPVEKLFSRQEHFDTHATHIEDVDSYFPLTRLHELAAAGKIGSVAARSHGVFTSYSSRKTLEQDGPEVVRRCREDGVDVALMTPI